MNYKNYFLPNMYKAFLLHIKNVQKNFLYYLYFSVTSNYKPHIRVEELFHF